MKTIALRTLLRDPRKVKRMTASGKKVRVTDNGTPLWVLAPAESEVDPAERARLIDEILDEVLAEEPTGIPLSKIVLDSRG